jgi:hypothetical protein
MRSRRVAAVRAGILDGGAARDLAFIWIPLVFTCLGCGSRAGVDLLGGPAGRGVQPIADGAPSTDSPEPMDAVSAPDANVTVDANVGDETTEIDAALDRSETLPDVVAVDIGTLDRSNPDVGPPGPTRDAGPCDGGLLCGNKCVNPLTDNDNCGACAIKCDIYTVGDVTMGGCKNGLCAPAYGACFTAMRPYFTCDEICAQESAKCIQAGCMGATHIEYVYETDCDSKVVSAIYTNEACNQPSQFASGERAGRCCCAKRPGERP